MTSTIRLISAVAFVAIAGLGTPLRAAHGASRTSIRPAASGTVRLSDWQFPDTLNPVQTNLTSAAMIDELINDDLVRYNAHGAPYALLLQHVPTIRNHGITNGGRTITLALKKSARWSNGSPVTSRDIWFAWKVGMDPLSGPACRGTCDKIASISTPNSTTAVLHLRHPYASAVPRALPGVLPEQWSNSAGSWKKDNQHQAAYQIYQNPAFNYSNPSFPTTGPYQVASVQAGSRVTLQPNPHYGTMSRGARLAHIIFIGYHSKSAMIAAAAAHKTDVTENYTLADLPALRRHANAYRVADMPAYSVEHLEFNVDGTYGGKSNPLSNVSVRQALALAVNKTAIIQKALHLGAAARQDVANTMWANRPGLHQQYANTGITGQWDPLAHHYVTPGSTRAMRDAKTLLHRTRWKSGFTLSAVTTTLGYRRTTLRVIAGDWAHLGIKLAIRRESPAQMLGGWNTGGTLAHGTFQVALFTWVGSPDPDSWRNELSGGYIDRRAITHSNINTNYAGIRDSAINHAFNTGAATYNNGTRARVYKGIQARVNQQAYWVPLYYGNTIATVDSRLKGFANNPTTAGIAWNGYAWHR